MLIFFLTLCLKLHVIYINEVLVYAHLYVYKMKFYQASFVTSSLHHALRGVVVNLCMNYGLFGHKMASKTHVHPKRISQLTGQCFVAANGARKDRMSILTLFCFHCVSGDIFQLIISPVKIKQYVFVVLSQHRTLINVCIRYFSSLLEDAYSHYINMMAFMTMVSLMSLLTIVFAYIPIAQGVTGVFLKKDQNENCTLILRCRFHQVEARNAGECLLLTATSNSSGIYYNTSAKLCDVCKPKSTFSSHDSDLGYYATGKSLTVIRNIATH